MLSQVVDDEVEEGFLEEEGGRESARPCSRKLRHAVDVNSAEFVVNNTAFTMKDTGTHVWTQLLIPHNKCIVNIKCSDIYAKDLKDI